MSISTTNLPMLQSVSQVSSPLASSKTDAATAQSQDAQPQDIVSLSAQALLHLKADQQRPDLASPVVIPDANATDDQKAAFQKELSSYEIAQQRVDATPFEPKYQAYVDIINDPSATDPQKLKAYMDFKVDSALEHGQTHQVGMSDVDFKFDWLTRDSDFLVRAHADDGALTTYNEQQTAAKKNNPGQVISSDQNSANQIDIISKSSTVQQGVATVDQLYDKFSWGLASWDLNKSLSDPRDVNTNREPNFVAPVAYAADPKTVIAQTVSSTLTALNLSHVATSSDPKDKAFVQLFTNLTMEFGQRVTERIQALATA